MCLFFSDKSIVLFEFLTVGEKRSKQIKGKHHYQGPASSTRKNLYHISNSEQARPWDFRCPASNITRRPTPDTKPYRISRPTHIMPPPCSSLTGFVGTGTIQLLQERRKEGRQFSCWGPKFECLFRKRY
jgi:hypothetical protein